MTTTSFTERVPRARGHGRRGFTLAELLVALGAVAILTVGLGRIFTSFTDLVATGNAVVEVNQTARAIETLMRRDFQNIGNPIDGQKDTYLVIRMREIGSPDRPIYLTSDDREADLRDRVDPYDPGSRAVTRRLDEIAFITGGGHISRQTNGIEGTPPLSSEYARIYYGHGLRPKPDPDWPPATKFDPKDTTAQRIARRTFEPDGYFGSPPDSGDPNPISAISNVTGRNQYAANWGFVRQTALLYGPVVGNPRTTGGVFKESGPGNGYEYAPFIRDTETFARVWSQLPGLTSSDKYEFGNNNTNDDREPDTAPDQRVLMQGEVDVVAQTRKDVRVFLEGEPAFDPLKPNSTPLLTPARNAPPFNLNNRNDYLLTHQTTGIAPNNFNTDDFLYSLWRHPIIPNSPVTANVAESNYRESLRQIRSALAGTVIRPLVEPGTPQVDSIDERDLALPDPDDVLMRVSGLLSIHCSSFEVAWSDGTRYDDNEAIDLNLDGIDDIRRGDMIWYDITRRFPDGEDFDPSSVQIDPNTGVVERRTLDFFNRRYYSVRAPLPPEKFAADSGVKLPYWDPLNPSSLVSPGSLGASTITKSISPEVRVGDGGVSNSLNILAPGAPVPGDQTALYDPLLTGGLPSYQDGFSDYFEHLVIFPFRHIKFNIPDADSGAVFTEEAWPKPKFVRVRVTLHDAGNRLEEGKRFEFVFSVFP